MYRLFYSPGACSLAVHVVLNECGLPVKLERMDLSQQPRSPELLKYNPRGQVPTLLEGEQVMVEGAAIMISLCEQTKSPLLPASGKERRDALQWLMFCNASLHPAYGSVFHLMYSKVDDDARDVLYTAAVASINKLWEVVEQHLSQSTYLAGNDVTLGDILLTVIANWSPRMPKPVTLGPKTRQLLAKISSRPSFKEALAEESVEYKVAA